MYDKLTLKVHKATFLTFINKDTELIHIHSYKACIMFVKERNDSQPAVGTVTRGLKLNTEQEMTMRKEVKRITISNTEITREGVNSCNKHACTCCCMKYFLNMTEDVKQARTQSDTQQSNTSVM